MARYERRCTTTITPIDEDLLQPLSLLLKACPLVDQLALYDVVNTPGVATDLSHISSVAKIEGFLPADDGMKKALSGADIVVIPAGIPREPTPSVLLRAYADSIADGHVM